MSAPHGPPGILFSADVARIWTQEATQAEKARVQAIHRMVRAKRGDTRCSRCGLTAGARTHRAGQATDQEIRQVAIKTTTVSSILKESRSPGGRYLNNPAPMPDGYVGNRPWWRAGRRKELRDWWNSRPTQADRPQATRTDTEP